MFFLILYARVILSTPWHHLRYSLIDSIAPAISALLRSCSMSEFFYSCLNLFWPPSRCTVSSHTPVTYQSKVHLPQWWKRKTASFTFSWAKTKSCCLLSGVPLALLPPGFLMALQMSSTFLSVSTLSLSGCLVPAFWWAIWMLNNWI